MFRRNEAEERHEQQAIQPKEVRMSDGSGSEVTVVGQGARLEGSIVSAGSLRVDGQVKGTINADGDVTLSPQSQVEADIEASNVTVAGRFTGNINVKNRAELSRGGRVDGNITSKTLVVSEGALFSGQSIMGEQGQGASGQAAKGSTASTSGGASGTSGATGTADVVTVEPLVAEKGHPH
jgi:cytoskeletal protein CcmA (bactofilin family)